MNVTKIILLCLLLAIGIGSCDNEQNFPDEPQIEYIGISKNHFSQGQTNEDSLIFFLEFTDGDGDIGFAGNDPKDIEIIDSRYPNAVESVSLAMIPEMGSGGGVSGSLQILKILIPAFDICCLLPNGRICETLKGFPEDTFTYLIRIRDRAGNWSNQIETDPVTYVCD